MKQGWEIKKLGDVCDVLNGLWIGKKEPFVNICVIRNTNFTKDCKLNLDNAAYIDAEVKQFEARKLKVGDIIIEKSGGSEKQPVGRVVLFDVETGDYSFSNFTSTLRVKSGTTLNPSFLHKCLYAHYLRGETSKLQSKTTGLHNLDMKGYLRLPVPVPPLAEQEKIVAELDCLSGIIEKKKQQLKEYDALAQSIFYTMFGDPITNEKGWEVLAIDDVCSSIVRGPFGSALKKDFFVKLSNDTYKVYEQKHAIQKNATIGTYYISSDMFKTLSRFEVKNGDIIMSCSGTIGEFYEIPNGAERGIMNQALLKFTLNSLIHKSYFLYTMEWVKDNFEKKGSGLQNIGSIKTIKETSISVPPLTLQQEFAKKIEAIEKQKELIKQSLAETETLFNSRMEFYFN